MELARSNVCTGVERSWPKRMFGKPTFNDLNPKEKRCIYRDMQRKGVALYGKYVDENRLKKRCRYRTACTLAPYREVRYLKHQFMRIKALGEKGNSATLDERGDDDGLASDELISGEMTDDEADDDGLIVNEQANDPTFHQRDANESLIESVTESSADNSQLTVINTGSTQREELASKLDLNDNNYNKNDDDGIDDMVNDENISSNVGASGNSIHSQNAITLPKRKSSRKRQSLSTQNISVRSITSMQENYILVDSDEEMVNNGIQYNHSSPDTGAPFNDLLSQSSVTSTVSDHEDERATQELIRTPVIDHMRPIQTPSIDALRNNARRRLVVDDIMPSSQYEEDSELDSLDFLSQNMLLQARTSTQN